MVYLRKLGKNKYLKTIYKSTHYGIIKIVDKYLTKNHYNFMQINSMIDKIRGEQWNSILLKAVNR